MSEQLIADSSSFLPRTSRLVSSDARNCRRHVRVCVCVRARVHASRDFGCAARGAPYWHGVAWLDGPRPGNRLLPISREIVPISPPNLDL